MLKGITVRVSRWSEYAGRSDIKHHTWFRFANRLLENEDFFEFSDAEILAWIYILSLCSQKKSDTVFINFERAERFARRKQKDILSAIQKLEGKQLDRIPDQDADGSRTDAERNPCTTLQDITLQDTTSQDRTAVRSAPQKANAFVRAYCDRFKSRWGENPQILGKDSGIAKRLAKDLGQDRFEYLLDAYFQMPDAWLVKIKHPLAAFETKLNEIVVFAESGQFHTQRQVREADSSATNALLLEKVRRGEL